RTAGVQIVGSHARNQPVVQDLVGPLGLVAVDLDVDRVHIVQEVDHIPAVARAHAGSTALLLSMRMWEVASRLPSSLCAASSPNRTCAVSPWCVSSEEPVPSTLD